MALSVLYKCGASRLCSACGVGLLLSTPWDEASLASLSGVLDDEGDAYYREFGEEMPEPRAARLRAFMRNVEALNPLQCAHCKAEFKDAFQEAPPSYGGVRR